MEEVFDTMALAIPTSVAGCGLLPVWFVRDAVFTLLFPEQGAQSVAIIGFVSNDNDVPHFFEQLRSNLDLVDLTCR